MSRILHNISGESQPELKRESGGMEEWGWNIQQPFIVYVFLAYPVY